MDKLPKHCPNCRIDWGLFPPANCYGSDHVRCIDCKAVYPPDDIIESAPLSCHVTIEHDAIAATIAFQRRVQPWMLACFGAEISADRLERGDRLLEEVLELLQSGDYPRERIASLTDYVWSRPAGEPAQEVGGVMVTLAAYCLAHSLDMHEAGEMELARIWTKVEAIRAKQAAKPTGSALPVAVEPAPPPPAGKLVADIQKALGSSSFELPPRPRALLERCHARITALTIENAAFLSACQKQKSEVAALTKRAEEAERIAAKWEHQSGVNLQFYEAEQGVRRTAETALAAEREKVWGLEAAIREAIDVFEGMNDDEINEELLPRLRALAAGGEER